MKTTKTVYVTIKVKIASDLEEHDAIDELANNTEYSIPSTDNVKVVDTELLEVSPNFSGT
jgi:hypothetical protein